MTSQHADTLVAVAQRLSIQIDQYIAIMGRIAAALDRAYPEPIEKQFPWKSPAPESALSVATPTERQRWAEEDRRNAT